MLEKFLNCLCSQCFKRAHRNVIGSYLLTIYARKSIRASKKKAHFLRSNLLEQEMLTWKRRSRNSLWTRVMRYFIWIYININLIFLLRSKRGQGSRVQLVDRKFVTVKSIDRVKVFRIIAFIVSRRRSRRRNAPLAHTHVARPRYCDV